MLSVMFFLFGSQMDLTDAILESFPDDSPELRGLRGENRGRLADEKAAEISLAVPTEKTPESSFASCIRRSVSTVSISCSSHSASAR